MQITMDFEGGPLDGTVSLERDFKAGETYSFLEGAILIAGATSGYRFDIGHRFRIPSPGWLGKTAVPNPNQPLPSYEYEITGRRAEGEQLVVEARYIEAQR